MSKTALLFKRKQIFKRKHRQLKTKQKQHQKIVMLPELKTKHVKQLELKKTGFMLLTASLITGCSTNKIDKTPSQHIYHAPAQAYNLFLGNPAVYGKPTLKESCSTQGSTLEIKDSAGVYHKIDVINLLANTGLTLPKNKVAAGKHIAAYYAALYNSNIKNPATLPIEFINYTNRKLIYIPLPLENAKSVQPKEKVVGLLVSKNKDFLYVVQHIQNHYNKKQMLHSLKTMQLNMRIPGKFTTDPSQKLAKKTRADNKEKAAGFIGQKETLGIISINPKTATPKQLTQWQIKARCY